MATGPMIDRRRVHGNKQASVRAVRYLTWTVTADRTGTRWDPGRNLGSDGRMLGPTGTRQVPPTYRCPYTVVITISIPLVPAGTSGT